MSLLAPLPPAPFFLKRISYSVRYIHVHVRQKKFIRGCRNIRTTLDPCLMYRGTYDKEQCILFLVFSVRLNIASEYTATREHKESESFIFCGLSLSLAVSKILKLFGLISLSWVMLDMSVPFGSQIFFENIDYLSKCRCCDSWGTKISSCTLDCQLYSMFNVKIEKKMIFLLDLLYAKALLAMASDRRLLPNWFGKGGKRTDTSNMDVYIPNIPFFWQESLGAGGSEQGAIGRLGLD